jgi:signal transduction histidine kinase
MREQLELANDGQKNLIHVMNHQIKGYLGKDRDIFAELLTDDYGKMPDAAMPLLKTGLKETAEGVEYVTQILRGASADTGALLYDMNKLDLEDLISKAFNEKKEEGERKGLEMNLATDNGNHIILGDEKQLGEAFRNLIDNAISYTSSGNVWVNLSEKHGKVLISVKDTGIGIKEEDKPRLFKSGGITEESIKINIKSSGYGLVFVRGVAEAHKGRVWLESDGEGKGTTFFVELPIIKK